MGVGITLVVREGLAERDNILPEVPLRDCPATRDLRCRVFQMDEKFRSSQKMDEKFRSPKM